MAWILVWHALWMVGPFIYIFFNLIRLFLQMLCPSPSLLLSLWRCFGSDCTSVWHECNSLIKVKCNAFHFKCVTLSVLHFKSVTFPSDMKSAFISGKKNQPPPDCVSAIFHQPAFSLTRSSDVKSNEMQVLLFSVTCWLYVSQMNSNIICFFFLFLWHRIFSIYIMYGDIMKTSLEISPHIHSDIASKWNHILRYIY